MNIWRGGKGLMKHLYQIKKLFTANKLNKTFFVKILSRNVLTKSFFFYDLVVLTLNIIC